MRCQWPAPQCGTWAGSLCECPGIKQYVPFRIISNKIAPTEDIEGCWKLMSMYVGHLTGRNICIQYSHSFVFKQKFVMLWRCNQCIQLRRPLSFHFSSLIY